jgi:hypothetical protein
VTQTSTASPRADAGETASDPLFVSPHGAGMSRLELSPPAVVRLALADPMRAGLARFLSTAAVSP